MGTICFEALYHQIEVEKMRKWGRKEGRKKENWTNTTIIKEFHPNNDDIEPTTAHYIAETSVTYPHLSFHLTLYKALLSPPYTSSPRVFAASCYGQILSVWAAHVAQSSLVSKNLSHFTIFHQFYEFPDIFQKSRPIVVFPALYHLWSHVLLCHVNVRINVLKVWQQWGLGKQNCKSKLLTQGHTKVEREGNWNFKFALPWQSAIVQGLCNTKKFMYLNPYNLPYHDHLLHQLLRLVSYLKAIFLIFTNFDDGVLPWSQKVWHKHIHFGQQLQNFVFF